MTCYLSYTDDSFAPHSSKPRVATAVLLRTGGARSSFAHARFLGQLCNVCVLRTNSYFVSPAIPYPCPHSEAAFFICDLDKGHAFSPLWPVFLLSWESSPHVLGPGTSPDLLHCDVKSKNKKEHGQVLQDHSGLKFLIFSCFLTMSSGVSPIFKIINFLYLLFLMNLHIQLSFYLISHGFATLKVL